MKPYTYLIIDIGCILIPFLFSFYKKHAFYTSWSAFFIACLFVGGGFILWDMGFTKIGVWGFNKAYLSGIHIYNLPLEEVLFFVCIPYACVFTYFAFKYLLPSLNIQKYDNLVRGILLLVGLLFIILSLLSKLYTLSVGVLLVICSLLKKDNTFISLSYLVIMPFFLISNGLLTGSFLKQPIVWYNPEHFTGIRIFTIPVEDFFYGYGLIFLTIHCYAVLNKNKY